MLGFLPTYTRAFVFVLVALIGARVFMRIIRFTPENDSAWFRAWLVLTAAAFFGGHFLIYSLLVGIVCAMLAAPGTTNRVQAYVVLLPLIPLFSYTLPGAFGISYILMLDHFRVLTICILLPAFFHAPAQDYSPKVVRNTVDFFFLGYCLWMILLNFTQRETVTDVLRGTVETLLFILLPFYAVRRLLGSAKDIEKVLVAMVFASILVGFVGIVEETFRWSFFDYISSTLHMDARRDFTRAQDIRFGLIRVKATIDGGVGYFFMLSIGAAICSHQLKLIPKRVFFPLLLILVTCLIFTGSRGPWFATAIMVCLMLFFRLFQTPVRLFFVAVAAIFLLPIVQGMILNTSDPFDTFSYRKKLLESSIPVIRQKPLLGWDNMQALEASGLLEHLRQGQGIIDIVNTFVGEALFGGIPRVVLFGGIFFGCLWSVVQRHKRDMVRGDLSKAPIAAFLSALTIATVFLLITVSMVGHIPAYVFLAASLCSAYAARPVREATEVAATQTDALSARSGGSRSEHRLVKGHRLPGYSDRMKPAR
ncbi:MAG: O-antigen ligase family protein [Steroidobacteraceae bacterium]